MLLSKKYILGHIAVVLIVIACFMLSYWQFSRLQDRKDLNKRIESRMTQKETEINSLIDPKISQDSLKQFEYRKVSMFGSYIEKGQVLISGRSREGLPGYNVATLFKFYSSADADSAENATFIYVNRGWIPQTIGDALLDGKAKNSDIAPPGGYETKREVVGLVRLNEQKQFVGGTYKKVSAENPESTRFSVELFANVSKLNKNDVLYPMWVQESYSRIGDEKVFNKFDSNDFPAVVQKPELTERNHFSYAIQWLAFGFVAIITWVVICRNALKKSKQVK